MLMNHFLSPNMVTILDHSQQVTIKGLFRGHEDVYALSL